METALLVALGLAVGLAIAALAVYVARSKGRDGDGETAAASAAAATDERIVDLGARVQQMGELLARHQLQFQTAINTRLDSVSQNLQTTLETRLDSVSQNLQTTLDSGKKDTTENLQKLNERLAVIDNAQKNLTELAGEMTSLRDVLSNKQTRGAFGQSRMEAIIQDGLPSGLYEFQFTLSNGKRPDCAVLMPNQPPLVIDAKFPLEAVTALRDGKSDDERKSAAARVRSDVMKHINDIAEKYLIPGETQDMALMFVPSEAVYAELHESFDDVVQKAYRAQVMMVSPTLLMLAIQVIRQIQKDTQMREAADQIQKEVGLMMKDVRLLGDRVRKLQTHFGQAGEDLNNIITSATRIEKRAGRIEELEFEGDTEDGGKALPIPLRKLEAGE